MRKRPAEGDAESPAASPRKGSPKKAKTPPKKAKDEQTLTFGQPCEIKYYRVAEFKLWHARHLDDRTDAFMKNMIDEIRSDPNCELRREYDFKGDVTRCVSVNDDNPMKNHRKSYERKFMLQTIEEDTRERDIATANSIHRVRIFYLCARHDTITNAFLLDFIKHLTADNPYSIEYRLDPDDLDATNGETVKMDTLVINADVVRAMKMLFDIKPGWGDEFSETVEEFFHPQNLTLSVRAALGIKLK